MSDLSNDVAAAVGSTKRSPDRDSARLLAYVKHLVDTGIPFRIVLEPPVRRDARGDDVNAKVRGTVLASSPMGDAQ